MIWKMRNSNCPSLAWKFTSRRVHRLPLACAHMVVGQGAQRLAGFSENKISKSSCGGGGAGIPIGHVDLGSSMF